MQSELTRSRSPGRPVPKAGRTTAGRRSARPQASVLAVAEAIHTVRHCLDMDVAFVSEFVADQGVVRYVDSRTEAAMPWMGDQPLCAAHPERSPRAGSRKGANPPPLQQIAAMTTLPIGAHISVALRRPDGRLYGTFCCFNQERDLPLGDRDLRLMQVFGDLIARQIALAERQVEDRDAKTERIHGALERGEPGIVYQPVFRLHDGRLLGAEALARFAGPPARSPDRWFGEAGEIGLQTALELQAIRNAVTGCEPTLRAYPDLCLAINAAPPTLLSHKLARLLERVPTRQITLEITEHDQVDDYARLTDALVPLRRMGCKIAVDDAGSGYASLHHILQIEPDVIKLDVSLTRGIDASATKRALAGGLIAFARQTGCAIIAEGIETAGELSALRDLQVDSAQGYLLARPAPIGDLCRRLVDGGHADVPIALT